MRRRLLLFGFCFFLALPPAMGELPDSVQAGLAAARIPADAMGVFVVRLSDGATLLAHREKESMQPASTMKLLTSLVALETLGPSYRGKTQLGTGAEITGGVLRGDIVLKGGGDVDLDWRAFERMLASLRLQGIQEIRGDFVLDFSTFRPGRIDMGKAPFDEAPEFRYNVIPDALLLNSYLVQLDLVSRDDGVSIGSSPMLAGVSFASDFQLVDRACDDWEDGWKIPEVIEQRGKITLRLRGEYPRNCKASTEIAVLDRVVFADRLFRSLWGEMGGKFRGRTRAGFAPADSRVLAEHFSRPLSEVIRDINKRSDNPITRVVYLALGAQASASNANDRLGGADTFVASERAVRAWLASHSIDAAGLTLENGSGLSRIERIPPEQLAAVLREAAKSRWAPEFLASLPIVAVDGGMRRRLSASPAAQQARIKTGTLRDVSAVAGYVEDARGRLHVVVAMINHELANRRVARPILDALLDWVAHAD